MKKKTLYKQAREHVEKSYKNKTLIVLAKEMGIGYEWIRKFNLGKIPSPSVQYIQKILDHENRAG